MSTRYVSGPRLGGGIYALERLVFQGKGCYPQYHWKQFAVCGRPELLERGLYLPMHSYEHPFTEPVPAEYYLPVFRGEIEFPNTISENREQRTHTILEKVYSVFNTAHPVGYCGRSLSIGDVVKLEENYYLCRPVGFQKVTFQASPNHPVANPTACPLILPNGVALQVTVYGKTETDYPCVNINVIASDGTENRVCFVEHNPEKEPGHELCVGVYCASKDDTVYYDSYFRD